MSSDTDVIEEELRALFAGVAPPPSLQRWFPTHGAAPVATGRPLRRGRRPVAARVLAISVIAAVAVVATVITRGRPATPIVPSRMALTVAVLPAGAQLRCTIAVSALSDVQATGFITFVGGRGTFHPVTTTGNTYIAGLRRWVETTPQMVAPDGRSYVTGSGDLTHSQVQVVDAAGTHTVLSVNRGFLSPLGFSPQGIVLLDTAPGAGGPPAAMPISLLDPHTGAVRALPLPDYPQVSSGAGTGGMTGYQAGTNSVWMQAYDSNSNISMVSRYDLVTGVTTVWFDGHTDGAGAAQPVAETGAGEPIIQLAGRDIEHIAPADRGGIDQRTLLMTSPHRAQVLNQGRVGDPGVADNLSPLSAIDGSSVWLAGDDGTLWRYAPADGLREMAAIRTSTNGAPGVSISGPCV
jgi:hypothetical protein